MESTLTAEETARKEVWKALRKHYVLNPGAQVEYVTGKWWTVLLGFFPPDPDERGSFRSWWYVARSPEDPERLTRKQRQEMHGQFKSSTTNQTGHKSATAWIQVRKDADIGEWKKNILAFLTEDPKPKTFNHICLELTDQEYTADILCMGTADRALFELVAERKVAHTFGCPAYFAHPRAYLNDNDEWVIDSEGSEDADPA